MTGEDWAVLGCALCVLALLIASAVLSVILTGGQYQ